MFIVGGIGVKAWKLGVDFSILFFFIFIGNLNNFPDILVSTKKFVNESLSAGTREG